MKHPLAITALLVGMFVVAQLIGLFLVNMSIADVAVVNGTTVLAHTTTAIGERPAFTGYESVLYLLGGILIGTLLLLVLIRYRTMRLWKFWFFLAVFLSTSVAFGVLLPQLVALALAFLLALWKIYKSNPWVHNLSELFIYAGIAVLLVPIFDVFWMVVVLLAISVYDIIAVWRTKHMVAMAQFQTKSELFAGLMVPKKAEPSPVGSPIVAPIAPPSSSSKSSPKPNSKPVTATAAKTTSGVAKSAPPSGSPTSASGSAYAILGGGDVAFPMLFAGAVMEGLVRSGATRSLALYESLIVVATAAVALTLLFTFAKKDRFYPAMPFLTAGCLAGWAITLLL